MKIEDISTGGGCTAVQVSWEDRETYILITRVDDPSIPEDNDPSFVGIYGPNDEKIIGFPFPTYIDAIRFVESADFA